MDPARLLHPRSIALGYRGEAWGVNPRRSQAYGVKFVDERGAVTVDALAAKRG